MSAHNNTPTPLHKTPLVKREIGTTGIKISPVALGCWPIAGVTSLEVNDTDSLATLRKAFDLGITHYDTAYCYGPQGESEKLIGKALGKHRDKIVLASKGGIHYEGEKQAQDARPETIISECEESLQRLGTDRIDLHYLHAKDPKVPVAESAEGFRKLLEAGKIRSVGVSNLSLEETFEFHAVCPISATQLPYNMLQRSIETETIPWCIENNVSVMIYWPLMKGLLAGKITTLANNDSRLGYPTFQGEEFKQNLCFVEKLREVAEGAGCTVAQLAIHWALQQPGITSALCGAKRAYQIEETAGASQVSFTETEWAQIDSALAQRGEAVARRLFR